MFSSSSISLVWDRGLGINVLKAPQIAWVGSHEVKKYIWIETHQVEILALFLMAWLPCLSLRFPICRGRMVIQPLPGYRRFKWAVVPPGTALSMSSLAWYLVPNVDSIDVVPITMGQKAKGPRGARGQPEGWELYIHHFVYCSSEVWLSLSEMQKPRPGE